MNKKILIGAIMVIIAAVVICGGLLIMNSTPEYKNVTVGIATFELPADDNGTVYNGEYQWGMGVSNYTSEETFVAIAQTGIATNLLTEDYFLSLMNGKDTYDELEEKNGVRYFKLNDAAYKYMGISKIGSNLVVVGSNDLDNIEHIFETMTFSSSTTNSDSSSSASVTISTTA